MTTSKGRLLFSGGAVAAVAAVALGGWWLSRPELPSDWSGRSQFCAEAQNFALANQGEITGDQRVEAMTGLIRSAPRELTPDLERLAGALGGHHEPATAHDHGTTGSSPETAEHDGGTAAHEHDAGTTAHEHEHASAADASPPDTAAVQASGRRAGEFIERTCGVNLPNIRT
ncbi:hypothetical protein [Micromonospora sp. NBC_00858]|uniref:hypothetical protein n=1 Tax=Micromonospora sp. NBC_00858 TaxID=2975979 RepID=UPI00386DE5A1|nr:hypothetical protein OG990_25755 [Micromonospora sp. NBC_00858]